MSEALVTGTPGTASAVAVAGSPWSLARRRLLRNRIAMAMLSVFLGIVFMCLAAPLYANHVAHTDPFRSNLDGTTIVDGKEVPIMQQETEGLGLGVTPIGPTWDPRHYLLGADNQGRDVAARLLYGGRNSLLIGAAAALMTCVIATLIGLAAGFFGGAIDGTLSRLLDIVWAFPVYLLAISLSTVLLTSGISLGPISIEAGSLLLPIDDHRRRLRALRGASDPRGGAHVAQPRVHRGCRRARGLDVATPLERRPAEHPHDGNRLLPDR